MRFTLATTLLLASTALAHPSPTPNKQNQPQPAEQPAAPKANGTAPAKCDPIAVAKLVGGIQANLEIQSQELKGVLKLQQLVAANNNNGTAANATDAAPPVAPLPAAAEGAYGAPAAPAPPAEDPAKAAEKAQKAAEKEQKAAEKAAEKEQKAAEKAQKAAAAFQQEQASVLAIQQAGIDFRAQNQVIAQQINSPAQDGLAIVAKAQVQEITQVQGLTGDAAKDDAVLKMLVQEVQDGTKQNEKNLRDAQSQCA